MPESNLGQLGKKRERHRLCYGAPLAYNSFIELTQLRKFIIVMPWSPFTASVALKLCQGCDVTQTTSSATTFVDFFLRVSPIAFDLKHPLNPHCTLYPRVYKIFELLVCEQTSQCHREGRLEPRYFSRIETDTKEISLKLFSPYSSVNSP